MTLPEERMREAFEKWYEADALPMESDWFRLNTEGDYHHAETLNSWCAWQAAWADRDEQKVAFYDGHGDMVLHSDLYDECPTCKNKEEDIRILRAELAARDKELAEARAENTRLEKLVYVPGLWKCARGHVAGGI